MTKGKTAEFCVKWCLHQPDLRHAALVFSGFSFAAVLKPHPRRCTGGSLQLQRSLTGGEGRKVMEVGGLVVGEVMGVEGMVVVEVEEEETVAEEALTETFMQRIFTK